VGQRPIQSLQRLAVVVTFQVQRGLFAKKIPPRPLSPLFYGLFIVLGAMLTVALDELASTYLR
jgi:hypothetical protein